MNPLQNYALPAFMFASGLQMAGYSNQGNVFYVRPHSGDDGQDGRSPQTAFKTLAVAKGACVANQNDVVYLMAESNTAANTTDYQAVVLTWDKDATHLIGVNSGCMLGQRSRISNLSTATAIVGGLVVVSANNCFISGVEVFQGQGGTNPTGASIAMTVSGQRNHFYNCQISGIGHAELDDATSRSLKVSGSENFFEKCFIGLDTIIRGTATAEIEISAGARNMFKDCFIDSYTSLTTFKAVSCGTPDRFVYFENCFFNAVQNITSAVAATGAIDSGSVNGSILLKDCTIAGYANITTADDAKVLVSGNVGFAGSSGANLISLAKAVDVA